MPVRRADSVMQQHDWERVEVLLHHTLELEVDERQAFLDLACADLPWARDEVASLLASADRLQPDFMDQAPMSLLVRNRAVDPGHVIGSYQLIRSLGSGGMGEVFLATDRRSGEQVAIKMLKFSSSGGELVERFRREREILARLDHPCIARLRDGGTAADGTPYLVMEYVEGEPLDAFARSRPWSERERLRLFCQICSAVEYLHEQQVLHRDLKPSNVMVGDGGEPKLLDFGIAKLQGPEHASRTPLTGCGQAPMSLDYAAPELLRGEPATASSDIYALGVLLYELLTGVSPYDGSSSLQQKVERICFEMPPEPSARLSRGRRQGAAEDALSAVRSPAELDALVFGALAKSPSQRYGTAGAMRGEIERYLATGRV